MERIDVTENFKKLDTNIKSLELRKGEFETEQGNKIPWKNYTLKLKINGIVMDFKLNKVFTDTLEEMLENKE